MYYFILEKCRKINDIYYIDNCRSNEQFNIALVLVLLYCMHAQGTPMACHQLEEGLAGTKGNSQSPMLIPKAPSEKQYFKWYHLL